MVAAAVTGAAWPQWEQFRARCLAQGHNDGTGFERPTLWSSDNLLYHLNYSQPKEAEIKT